MPGSESFPSPLVAIRDKERALASDIRAAQERADAKVADARTRAESLKQQAEREGMQEAEALYQQGLTRAREQAQVVSAEGQAQAAKQHEAGLGRIGKAVDYILQFVLPHSQ
jgi:V/A-type H+-transporting ATPase subunit G/H